VSSGETKRVGPRNQAKKKSFTTNRTSWDLEKKRYRRKNRLISLTASKKRTLGVPPGMLFCDHGSRSGRSWGIKKVQEGGDGGDFYKGRNLQRDNISLKTEHIKLARQT